MPLVLYGCAAQPVSFDTGVPRGHILARPGRPGFVVAAPRATSDRDTGHIAAEIARRTGFGLVVANSIEAAARQVSLAYEQRVQEAAQGRLTFYVEIHGNGRHESAARIEVATVGIDREDAVRLRTLLELIRDVHVRAHPATPRLEIRVEPADAVRHAVAGAKRDGILRPPARALHFELPKSARTEWRETYTTILADFLAQAAALPARR